MYMRSSTIQFFIDFLTALHPEIITKVRLTDSIEGREISAMRLRAGSRRRRRGVLFIGGIHARELLNPDMLIELTAKLVTSYDRGTDIVLGGRVWPYGQIEAMLENLDILILPNANPDGREAVFDVNRLWRKNRRVNPGTACMGVDLNRNFDFLWGIETVRDDGYPATSSSPCRDVFFGSDAFSEPETANVKTLLDNFNVRYMVDVHSASNLILYPWGHAPTQSSDSSQRFNLVDTSGWSVLPTDAPNYEEFMPAHDVQRFNRMAQAAADAIKDVHGTTYGVRHSLTLYPTTGTSTAYAYSRHIVGFNRRKVYAFTFETGPRNSNLVEMFQPSNPLLGRIKEEASSGLLSMLLQAVCAFDAAGSGSTTLSDLTLDGLRKVRDRRFSDSQDGRQLIEFVERHQHEILTRILDDNDLLKAASSLLEQSHEFLDESSTLAPEFIEAVLGFIERISAAACTPELKRDLELVSQLVGSASGKRTGDVLTELEKATSNAETRA